MVMHGAGLFLAVLLTLGPGADAAEIQLRILTYGEPEPVHQEKMMLGEENAYWNPPAGLDMGFLSLQRVKLEPPHREGAEMEMELRFLCVGDEDPARKILADLVAYSVDGTSLFHTWCVETDERLGPREVELSGRTFVRSPQNEVSFEVPYDVSRQATRFDITFREMAPDDLYHFAPAPDKFELAMTRPDPEGHFVLSFKNPQKKGIDPARHGIVLVLTVRNEKGEVLNRIVETQNARVEGEGTRYQFDVQVPQEYIDHSSARVTFYTRQEDNEKFIDDFFRKGNPSGYRGIWLTGGNDLISVPFEP